MKSFKQKFIEHLADNYSEYSKDLLPKYMNVVLKDAKKNFKQRKPHVIAMKRKAIWSCEDVRHAFNYNEHNFKLIKQHQTLIRYFECFIELTENSDSDFYTKSERIRFSRDCIMQAHRLIVIYKATIITA